MRHCVQSNTNQCVGSAILLIKVVSTLEKIMITTDLHLSADQCKSAADRGYLNLGSASIGNFPFKFNVKTVTNAHAGKVDGEHHIECDGRSWVKLDTYETFMQNVTLTVNLKFLEKRIHPYIRESTILFRKMRSSLRLFSICEIHTRLPSIHNAYSQNHLPLTTLWQSIACRLLQYTFRFHSDLNFHSR